MKRKLFLSLILIIGITLLFGGTSRVYVQRCSLADGSEAPVTNPALTTSPDYIVRATMIGPPDGPETLGTDLGTPATSLNISRMGNGTTVPYYTGTYLQLGTFPTQWQAGWTIHMYVKYIPTQEVAEWEIIIPPGTTLINIQDPVQVIPPYPVITQVLTITSEPTGQPIWINGEYSGFITPHDFENPTAGDVYTINNPAYTWNPPSYTVPEGFTTTTINFIGTPIVVNHYALTVNAYKDGVEQHNVQVLKDGQPVGITFVPITSTNVADLTGIYSLATTTLTGGQFWDPATITVSESDFVEIPGGKGANLKVASLGSKNGPKTDYAHSITFQMKTRYTLNITGPVEAGMVGANVVTGPWGTVGTIPDIILVDENDNTNNLLGIYTIETLPRDLPIFIAAGLENRKHWIQNPKTVTADMFEDDVATLEFQWIDYLARWDIECVTPGTHLYFIPSGSEIFEDYGELPITLYYHGTKENWDEWKDPDEGDYKLGTIDGPDPDDEPLYNPGPDQGDKQSHILTICSIPDHEPISVNGQVSTPAVLTTAYYADPTPGTTFAIANPNYTWDPQNYVVPDPFVATTITFIGTPIDHWTLTVQAYKGTEEQHNVPVLRNGAPIGVTFVPITKTDSAEIFGNYSLSHTSDMLSYEFWYPETIPVDQSIFSGKGMGLKSGNKNGPKTDYTATINFEMRAKYQVILLGPQDYEVTLPDGNTVTIDGEMLLIDEDDLVNNLLGDYTISDAPTGFAWDINPITLTPADFDENGIALVEFFLHPIAPPPLPVELTSFTAVLTNEFYVQLTWISQTETNLSGYRVYRNEENNLNNAILITPTMIPATNTSQEHIYTIEDREVENHTTYYYWLESVDFNNSQFHGPVIVVVEGNVPPVMPEITTLKNAYPNPFRANNSTNIEVAIKAGETGTLTIYNIMGQVVKTYKVTEGIHTIQWNGRDSQGNICGSGIYFYKLTTPSLNQTKKMVIVK